VPREKRLISLKEAADYLGVSSSTLYRLLKRGLITAFKIGSDWQFEYAKLDEWIEAQPPGSVQSETRGKRRAS
jgi:excisionase family DNA binding protein